MSDTKPNISPLTSSLIVEDAKSTIESYVKALGAEVCGQFTYPKTGKIMHSCLNINGSSLFIYDVVPEKNMHPTGRHNFYLYTDNADKAAEKAKAAGWQEAQAAEDTFWGDRMAILIDPNGNTWMLAHKAREVSMEEMQAAVNNM